MDEIKAAERNEIGIVVGSALQKLGSIESSANLREVISELRSEVEQIKTHLESFGASPDASTQLFTDSQFETMSAQDIIGQIVSRISTCRNLSVNADVTKLNNTRAEMLNVMLLIDALESKEF